MVRQIRKCSICSKRFIALHSTQDQCGCTSTGSSGKEKTKTKKKKNDEDDTKRKLIKRESVLPSILQATAKRCRVPTTLPKKVSSSSSSTTTTTTISMIDLCSDGNSDTDFPTKNDDEDEVHPWSNQKNSPPLLKTPPDWNSAPCREDPTLGPIHVGDDHVTNGTVGNSSRNSSSDLIVFVKRQNHDPTSTTNKKDDDDDDDDTAGEQTRKNLEQDDTDENAPLDCDDDAIQNPPVLDWWSEAEEENDSIHDDDDDDDDDDETLLLADLWSNPNHITSHPRTKFGDDRPNEASSHDHVPIHVETSMDDPRGPMNHSTTTTTDSNIATTTAATTTSTITTTGSTNMNSNNNMICWICGTNLWSIHQRSGRKGRVQHMKRCSKKHNVALQDLICPDDEYDNDDHQSDTMNPLHPPSLTSGTMNTTTANNTVTIMNAITSNGGPKNPYLYVQQNWHDHTVVPTVTVPSIGKDVNRMLMAGARRSAKMAELQHMFPGRQGNPSRGRLRSNNTNTKNDNNSRGQRHHQTATTGSSAPSRSCPKYKMIPGTDFVCDGFHYANVEFKNYFLTHFHSDHYGGITKHWNLGTIYCSVPTANLVHSQLGVSKQYIHPLPLDTPTIILANNNNNNNNHSTAVTVTLLNANHCPGAIMFLFEVGHRVILHVGDFRWNYPIMSRQPPLRSFCRIPWTSPQQQPVPLRRIDDLFLDTTYCDAQYTLPTQSECISAVIEVVQQEMVSAKSNKANIILLFGAYTIGKEAVYMSVAKHFKMKVYVDQRRYRILSSLEWSQDDISILTTNPELTNLWVVPLGHINMSKLSNYRTIRMKNFQRVYDRVIGFRPTGWTLQKKKGTTTKTNTSVIGTTIKGFMTLHTVPYSEHSSFPELVECLESLNPKRIIPTVNASKSQQQIDLLMTHWRLKQEQLFLER